ncbi:MAG: hypothetical protein JXA96_08340 [Sedimentisphaerales bacterium]|nr:hypothetical protein [Sedimentisphaerales bacterium]
MDDQILKQLIELAAAFNKIGPKPVICGGLGIYLALLDKQSELPLRTTYDIDLMLIQRQILEDTQRQAIAEIITGDLQYRVCEDGKYYQFEKENQELDILTPENNFIESDGFRAKIVKSRLHGYITFEAKYIEEDLKIISLSKLQKRNEKEENIEVFVPSFTNLMILKLFAFRDRNSGPRQNDNKARAHAFDIYNLITLTSYQDYKEGLEFIERHKSSEIINEAQELVRKNFSTIDSSGWIRVLENTTTFYPDINMIQKRDKIENAQARLTKWFLS